jgi:sRNA-binding protein
MWMQATWPGLFDAPSIKPLMIGAGKEIVAQALAAGQNRQGVHAALRAWTGARRYLMALANPMAMRHGLDGNPVESVTLEHRETAAKMLAERIAAAKMKAHGGGAPKHRIETVV